MFSLAVTTYSFSNWIISLLLNKLNFCMLNNARLGKKGSSIKNLHTTKSTMLFFLFSISSVPVLFFSFAVFWFSSVETFKWKLTDAIPHNLTAPEGSLFPPDVLQHLFEADFALLLFHLKLEAPMRRDEKVHVPRQGFDPRCHTLTDISTYIETCCSQIYGNKQDCSAG